MRVRIESVIAWAIGGLIVGGFATSELSAIPNVWAGPLFLGALGVVLGTTPFFARNAGIIVGGGVGIVLWEIALANYLVFRGGMGPIDWYIGGLVAGLVGSFVAVTLGLRGDPRQMATVGVFSVAGHVVTRLWLEDYPTAIGLVGFVMGAVVGRFIWRSGRLRESMDLVLGAVVGIAVAWTLLLPALSQRGLLWRPSVLKPVILLGAAGVMGALALLVLRSVDRPPQAARITPDN